MKLNDFCDLSWFFFPWPIAFFGRGIFLGGRGAYCSDSCILLRGSGAGSPEKGHFFGLNFDLQPHMPIAWLWGGWGLCFVRHPFLVVVGHASKLTCLLGCQCLWLRLLFGYISSDREHVISSENATTEIFLPGASPARRFSFKKKSVLYLLIKLQRLLIW